MDKLFYATTAISYTNGEPHIGHAYEFIVSDIIVRYHRLFGYKTYLLTGTDEHGQKVATSAIKRNKSPKEHCDYYVEQFKELDNRLNISYDRFIRTTDEDHIKTAQQVWLKCVENNDIYLSSYIGWYNEREECFVSDSDAESNNYLDLISGLPLKKVEEESYFFRLSKYCDKLIEYIESNPDFIQPREHRASILYRLKTEGLKDLSISRTSFDWGIPVPNDLNHVMYVWFDALTNYLSGIDIFNNNNTLSSFWDATKSVHIIGKDIIWFHGVIFPCMLMSANISIPKNKSVFAHGFINADDGRKMSKSLNNAIDPYTILNILPVDTLRYYMSSTITFGSDLNFSISNAKAIHNNELADILGNLVNRVLVLANKFCDNKIPNTKHIDNTIFPFDLDELKQNIILDLSGYSINNAILKTMNAIRNTNKYLTEMEPWKLKGEENNLKRQSIVRTALELIYIFTHFIEPIMPQIAQKIFYKLNSSPKPLDELDNNFYNLILQ